MNIKPSPKQVPAAARPVGAARTREAVAPLSDMVLDRFCQPFSPAELDTLRQQALMRDHQLGRVSELSCRLQELELSVEFLRLYREQHFPHRGAAPTEQEAASLQAQTRIVIDSLADLIGTFKAEGLHPVGLMVTLRQLRHDSAGITAPAAAPLAEAKGVDLQTSVQEWPWV